MKKLHLALATVVILVLGSCSKSIYFNPYSTSEVVTHNTQGAVTLRGVGDETLLGNEEAIKLAHKKALQQLFYLGYVGTDFKNPMIKEGQGVEMKHKAFFDEFWASGYERFITNSKPAVYPCKEIKNKKCKIASAEFTVNYNMLRKELEQKKIINKIGF